MSVKSLPVVLLCLASGFLMSAGASAHDIKNLEIDINFAQTFDFRDCPSTAPVGDTCIYVTGVTDQPRLQHLAFNRIAMVNPSTYDNSHPSCLGRV